MLGLGIDRRVSSEAEALAFQRAVFGPAYLRATFPFGDPASLLERRRAAFVLRFVPPGGTVLDLGCGDGSLTRRWAERARRVIAVDLSPDCLALAVRRNPHRAISYVCVPVEHLALDVRFDVVFLGEVVEHVYDAPALLRRAAGLLRPGGTLILTTPNATSLTRRIAALPGPRQLYRRWRGRDPRAPVGHEHVAEYPLAALEAMLRAAGLRVVARGGYGGLIPTFVERRLARFVPRDYILLTGALAPRLAAHVWLAAQGDGAASLPHRGLSGTPQTRPEGTMSPRDSASRT